MKAIITELTVQLRSHRDNRNGKMRNQKRLIRKNTKTHSRVFFIFFNVIICLFVNSCKVNISDHPDSEAYIFIDTLK